MLQTSNPELRPLNDETRRAVQRDSVELSRLPFRVGRESRAGIVDGEYRSLERRAGQSLPNNELYMLDRHRVLNISREHFLIDRNADGDYVLVDRGSACGTIVDDCPLGGHDQGGQAVLHAGSIIRVGTADSPYLFEFVPPGA